MATDSLVSILLDKNARRPDDIALVLSFLSKICGNNMQIPRIRDVIEVLKEKVEGMSAKGIATTLLSASKLRVNDATLLQALCQSAMKKTREFNSQEIANTLNALSKFDHYEKGLVIDMAAEHKASTNPFS